MIFVANIVLSIDNINIFVINIMIFVANIVLSIDNINIFVVNILMFIMNINIFVINIVIFVIHLVLYSDSQLDAIQNYIVACRGIGTAVPLRVCGLHEIIDL
jgi:hypothetical protein